MQAALSVGHSRNTISPGVRRHTDCLHRENPGLQGLVGAMQRVLGGPYLSPSTEGQAPIPNLREQEKECKQWPLGCDGSETLPARSLGDCNVESSGLLKEVQPGRWSLLIG